MAQHYYPRVYGKCIKQMLPDKLPAYIKECRDMGIEVLPPSVNESGRSFTPVGKGIRFGLASIKNVGKACDDIIEARKSSEKFKNLKDFINKMVETDSRATNKRVIESLIMAGALDEFGLNRKQMMSGCVEYIKNLKEYFKKRKTAKKEETIERARKKVEQFHFLSLPAGIKGRDIKT